MLPKLRTDDYPTRETAFRANGGEERPDCLLLPIKPVIPCGFIALCGGAGCYPSELSSIRDFSCFPVQLPSHAGSGSPLFRCEKACHLLVVPSAQPHACLGRREFYAVGKGAGGGFSAAVVLSKFGLLGSPCEGIAWNFVPCHGRECTARAGS